MRTIKFRGQRLDNNEWVYGCIGYGFNQSIQYIMPKMYFATRDFGEVDENGEMIIEDEIAIGGFIPVNPETVGQFTGLQDKNGVEIYEGDIIQYKNCSWHKRWWSNISEIEIIEKECEEQRKYITQFTSVVRYDDCMFKLDYPILLHDVRMNHKEITRKTNNGDSYSKYWGFEVVGNIHDNPELLTKN